MWRGQLLHIEVYSPDRRPQTRTYYPRSHSVDEHEHLSSERELIQRIQRIVQRSPIRKRRTKEPSLPTPKDPPRWGSSNTRWAQRNCSPLVEFSPRRDLLVTYRPLQLATKVNKKRTIRLPLL